ncbi:MAG: diacylglycerol/lipid kinase family protein [Candidatus Sericytochromatia bacterium]
MKRVFLLANPGSLSKRGSSLEQLHARLENKGLVVASAALGPDTDAQALQERIRAHGPETLLVAGGDGSIHHAVQYAVPLELPLGVLPLGTANDFARTLNLPLDLEQALALLNTGRLTPIDLGRLESEDGPPHYFLNAAHLGLGVETVKRVNPDLKRLIGPLAYAVALAESLRSMQPLALHCSWPGQTERELSVSQVLIGNGRHFGGGALIGPSATLDDGLLDVYLFESRLGLTGMLRVTEAFRRNPGGTYDGLLQVRTAALTLKLEKPAQINLDGELFPVAGTLEVTVLPGHLQVWVA